MNLHISTEDMAKINAALAAEKEPTNKIDQAVESAMDIRKSLASIHGEPYARLVEIGVLTHKLMKLVTFLNRGLIQTAEGYEEAQARGVLEVAGSICAKMLTHASEIYAGDVEGFDAAAMTKWMDRISDAEEAAAKLIEEEFFKNEDQ